MSFPSFYDPAKVGTLYVPNTFEAVTQGQAAGLSPADQDHRRVLLLLVDAQVDFIHPDGALSVPGAVDDTRRTIEWLYRHVGQVTAVAASLDSHTPIQIFYPTWWADQDGNPPAPFTLITADDVRQGRWKPLFEPEWSVRYVQTLEAQAKKILTIWPFHTMIGTPGQTLTPALYEAIAYHAGARRAQPIFLTKGAIPKTENYSILEPEVKVPDHPLGDLNRQFLEMLTSYDLVYIAGQAKSHCVLETATSIMRYFADQPDRIARLRFLIDCTSSVVHPQIDFDALANAALTQFEAQGLHLVRSTDPLG